MKKHFLFIIGSLILLFASCEKKHTPEEVKSTLSSGTWHVSFYSIGGSTSFDLDNYDYTFLSSGTAKADGDGTHVEGIWSVSQIDGDNVLDLYLGHSHPFDQLDNAWRVTGLSSDRVETENTDNETIYLTFEKN